MNMIKKYFLNLRPYSWIDLFLLGFLAKFFTASRFSLETYDLYMVGALLSLWFFFNLALEAKHNYSYRGKISVVPAIIFLLIAIVIGIIVKPYSLIFIGASTLFVLIYLQKNRNALLGNCSSIVRGIISMSYFFFALAIYSSEFTKNAVVLGISIFLLSMSRSLIGDIRDIKHNREAKKKTFPVTFGTKVSKTLIIISLLIVIILQSLYFNSIAVSLPIILFGIGLTFSRNGYVLHQLMILTTSFFSANMILFFVSENLLLLNILYVGIFLNFIFYPLLKRKSNPTFVQD